MTESIRAFISIELPEPQQASLGRWQAQLGPDSPVKWVAPEGIHLTLKFLGNISPEQVGPVSSAMTGATEKAAPFAVVLGGLGAFPSPRSPRVIWVGVDAPELPSLQRRLEELLVPLGFPKEDRPFTPHLTLGRVRPEVRPQQRGLLAERLASFREAPLPPFTARSLCLVRSTLTPKSAVYTLLFSAPLGAAASQ